MKCVNCGCEAEVKESKKHEEGEDKDSDVKNKVLDEMIAKADESLATKVSNKKK